MHDRTKSWTGPIRAVIFDMGDVLYDASQWRRWMATELARYGVSLSFPELVMRWEKHLVPVYQGTKQYQDAYQDFLGELLPNPQVREQFREESLKAKSRFESLERKPFPGVSETLRALRDAGLLLAVLTDTESPSPAIRQSLKNLGLHDIFECVVSSRDVGFVKPEPQSYQAVLDLLGCRASEALFVGHDQDELDGAAKVGMHVLAVDTTGPVVAHRVLDRFDDLQSMLEPSRPNTQPSAPFNNPVGDICLRSQ